MEYFFEEDRRLRLLLGEEARTLGLNQISAFVKYIHGSNVVGFPPRTIANVSPDDANIHKRMIGLLKRKHRAVNKATDSDRERCCRHMINERMRREKQKQSYLKLLSILPPRTKNNKNSIVQGAAKEVEELQKWKVELERENNEIEEVVLGGRKSANIKVRVPYPSSGIDSMLAILNYFKQTHSRTTAIRSQFSPQLFSAVFDVNLTEIEAAKVDVEHLLKLRGNISSISGKDREFS